MSFQITLIRHGKADTTLPNHRMHPLSEEGKDQARRRREALGNPKYDLVLHSSLPRTKETALIVAGLDQNASTIEIPEFLWNEGDPRGEAIEAVFPELGNASLADYEKRVRQEITSIALEASQCIRVAIRKAGNPKKILAVGHSVLTQAICTALCGHEDREKFQHDVLGECQGYRLYSDKSGTIPIERIK